MLHSMYFQLTAIELTMKTTKYFLYTIQFLLILKHVQLFIKYYVKKTTCVSFKHETKQKLAQLNAQNQFNLLCNLI